MAHTDSSPVPDSQETSEVILSPRVQRIINALKQKESPTAKAVLKEFQKAASWFTLGIDPFVRLSKVLNVGFEYRIVDDADSVPTTGKDAEKVKQLLKLFDRVLPLINNFEAILCDFAEDAPKVELLFKFMTTKAQQERASDTASLKSAIYDYLPDRCVNPGEKKSRGFNHTPSARLLCPHRFLDEFDKDPEAFQNQVKNTTIKVTSREFPTFLYDEQVNYDPQNKDFGLLQGRLLVSVYRHIFTGPRTALTGPHNPKAKLSKGQIYRRHGCDPYTIAYAAIQTYFALSSAEHWTTVIGGFDLNMFYQQIVDLFEDEVWAKETLEWWNCKVGFYGSSAYDSATSQTETDSGFDELEDIKYQRLRRAQRRVELASDETASSERPTPPSQGDHDSTNGTAEDSPQSTPPAQRQNSTDDTTCDGSQTAFNMRGLEEGLSDLNNREDDNNANENLPGPLSDNENNGAQNEINTRASKGRSVTQKRRAEEPPAGAPAQKKGKTGKSKSRTSSRKK